MKEHEAVFKAIIDLALYGIDSVLPMGFIARYGP
jgi:hypothetical protein